MYTTSKQFKVQIIGVLEEIDSFYWPKMQLWIGEKKIGQGPPPLIWTKSKRTAFFFRETIPTPFKIIHSCVGMMEQTAISNQTEGSGWWQKKYYEGWAAFQKYTEASPVIASAPHPHFSSSSVWDAVQKNVFFVGHL